MQLSPVESYTPPWRPEFGPEGKHFVSGNSLFFYFWGSSEAAVGGRAAPVWRVYEPKKTGAHSARARMRAQNPLVYTYYFIYVYLFCWPHRTPPWSVYSKTNKNNFLDFFVNKALIILHIEDALLKVFHWFSVRPSNDLEHDEQNNSLSTQ